MEYEHGNLSEVAVREVRGKGGVAGKREVYW